MPILVCDLPLAEETTSSAAGTWTIRPCSRNETEELGALYFAAYDPGLASATLEEAIADTVASFEGEYGDLIPEASLVAIANEELIGAVLIVRRAPWSDVPDCPFVIELFTAPEYRRAGVARSLMLAAMDTPALFGEKRIALRVDSGNAGARRLYESLGFSELS